MTRSARAAALRSTALATSLVLAVGLSAMSVEAWAKPKMSCWITFVGSNFSTELQFRIFGEIPPQVSPPICSRFKVCERS